MRQIEGLNLEKHISFNAYNTLDRMPKNKTQKSLIWDVAMEQLHCF